MAVHINVLAVALAAVAGFAFGAVWYVSLGARWLDGLGTTAEKQRKRLEGRLSPFVVSAVALVLMALVLDGFIELLGGPTVRRGFLVGLFCWLGFVLTTIETNHAYGGARRSLTLIDAGHWLGVLLIQGVVIGAVGPSY